MARFPFSGKWAHEIAAGAAHAPPGRYGRVAAPLDFTADSLGKVRYELSKAVQSQFRGGNTEFAGSITAANESALALLQEGPHVPQTADELVALLRGPALKTEFQRVLEERGVPEHAGNAALQKFTNKARDIARQYAPDTAKGVPGH